ncbi:hypothetical protein Hanom_Chr12g01092461 [Helianthus anomalus]
MSNQLLKTDYIIRLDASSIARFNPSTVSFHRLSNCSISFRASLIFGAKSSIFDFAFEYASSQVTLSAFAAATLASSFACFSFPFCISSYSRLT